MLAFLPWTAEQTAYRLLFTCWCIATSLLVLLSRLLTKNIRNIAVELNIDQNCKEGDGKGGVYRDS